MLNGILEHFEELFLDDEWADGLYDYMMKDLKYEIDDNFTLDEEMSEEEYWELRNILREDEE